MKIDSAPGTRVRFGIFEADLRSGELRRNGLKVKIQELPFQVLTVLLERSGEVVTREELRKRLWAADTFVDFEQGLNKAINKLREALGDNANNPRFVETLPRRGYRFIGPVEALQAGTGPRQRSHSSCRTIVFSVAGIVAVLGVLFALNVAGLRNRLRGRTTGPSRIHSIAVLPLENLSSDHSQDYFADGMTEELITELSRISGLRVIARTSSMRYKGTKKSLTEIARELNVDAVVEGSVLRSGDWVRINAQLVAASTQGSLWAQTYQRDLGNVLSLQDDVARAIAQKIQAKITPQEQQRLQAVRKVDPAAYDAYLRGRYLFDQRDPTEGPRATQYFHKAIDLNPDFAAAYAGLAVSLLNQASLGAAPPDEVMPRAREAARHALQLDPDSGEAYTALGAIEIHYDWDWDAARKNLLRGIQLNPSDTFAEFFYADYLLVAGRTGDAVLHMQRAVKLDPVSFYANRQLASMLYFSRRYEAALAQLKRTEELQANPSVIDNWRSFIYEATGMYDKAVDADIKLLADFGVPATDLNSYRSAYARGGWRGYWQYRVDRLEHGAKAHYGPYYMRGIYCLRIGNVDEAFRWLRQAADHRSPWLFGIATDPKLDAIRYDPRYQALLRRMNFPSESAGPKPPP